VSFLTPKIMTWRCHHRVGARDAAVLLVRAVVELVVEEMGVRTLRAVLVLDVAARVQGRVHQVPVVLVARVQGRVHRVKPAVRRRDPVVLVARVQGRVHRAKPAVRRRDPVAQAARVQGRVHRAKPAVHRRGPVAPAVRVRVIVRQIAVAQARARVAVQLAHQLAVARAFVVDPLVVVMDVAVVKVLRATSHHQTIPPNINTTP